MATQKGKAQAGRGHEKVLTSTILASCNIHFNRVQRDNLNALCLAALQHKGLHGMLPSGHGCDTAVECLAGCRGRGAGRRHQGPDTQRQKDKPKDTRFSGGGFIAMKLWAGGKFACAGGGGGVRAPFPPPPPFWAPVTAIPNGLTGEVGGVLRYHNIYNSKRSPRCADHFEVCIMGEI